MPEKPNLTGAEAERAMARMSRRGFVLGAVAALAGVGGMTWLRFTGQEGGLPWPLRRVLQFNESLAQATFSPERLSPTFPEDRIAVPPRINGGIGMVAKLDPAAWTLRVEQPDKPAREFTLDGLNGLARVDMVSEFKCIEGWSQIVQWGGVRLLDFLVQHKLGTRDGQAPDLKHAPNNLYKYVYMQTPDAGYYVGLDMPSALHSQTLLCDTINGQPLPSDHGAPLRLVIPIKYGIKNIKRIGLIRFQDERPADYWAERRYDWYAGL